MNPGNKSGITSLLARVMLPRSVRRVVRDRRGVAATEFALILPFMFIILIGMAEITGAMNNDRKVSRISNSITDLVAQAQTVTPAELTAVMDLGEVILAPDPADDLYIIIASVTFDEDGDPEVDWSYDSDGGAPWTPGAAPPITLPDTIGTPNSSIVVGQSTLEYTPPFSGLFTSYFSRNSMLELSDTYYLRPRLTDTVECPAC
ncbi:TadE/TadG family type IV pilus assembly protein [Roseibium sp. Sym1]|uniref:TadE/TadG family type IV pilus assembly protein n=1 Tax=Roseibium sp. Sym1 TaxID=3016006 RepID=UPI0022B378CF|nr:TadE/TadG family type IV pilus assembly protein [Roseibium sp. Sym1]